MIIIEETEEDKNRAALPDEDSFEDEELTTEEAKYRSAKDLRDSLECVERYEQGVRTLLDAAALFDEIDDYEDSARLAEECRKKAERNLNIFPVRFSESRRLNLAKTPNFKQKIC